MNPITAIHDRIRVLVQQSAAAAKDQGLFFYEELPEFTVETPKDAGHGDFACNLALLLARQAKQPPRSIAEHIAARIMMTDHTFINKVEVAGAGFINFFLSPKWLHELLPLIDRLHSAYGQGPSQQRKVQVEFVSANPTGNLHMGNARGGVIGDTVANLLKKAGYEVEKEYYINDAGNQIEIFAASLEARYLQMTGEDVDFPEDGYAGQDVIDTVQHIVQQHGDAYLNLPPAERRALLVQQALKEKEAYIQQTLARFGIYYDCWFSEKQLHASGAVADTIAELRKNGFVYEQDGALWLKMTAWGDEKDEVLVRANGIPTYFAADIAYHKNKFARGFDWVINVWGADHHGHVARMKAALAALSYDPERLDVILIQLVRLYRGGEVLRMSKRTGVTVSLDELIDEVGRDAARFFFVMRNPDSHLDFDLELAQKQSQENPVYYVQYAYARIKSIFRQAQAMQISLPPVAELPLDLLGSDELQLLRRLADFPEEITQAARLLAPHRIARYLLDLAGAFHSYYNHNRVLNAPEDIRAVRLAVLKAVAQTLKNALDVLGVSAPEQM